MAVKFDPELHKRYLLLLLVEIFKDLDGKIAFKGGTCAALFYGLNRFSFDLDFDILEELTQKDIATLQKLLSSHGRVRNFSNKYFTLFFLFDYGSGYPNIKVELNKRLWNNNHYEVI